MKKETPNFFFIITILYFVLVIGVSLILNKADFHIARINLDHSNRYVREGFIQSDLISPDLTSSEWFVLPENIFNAKEAGFLDENKKPFLSFHDDPNRVYTYIVEFNITPEQYNSYFQNALTPALFIPGVSDNWEAYLNGNLIASEMYPGENNSIRVHRNMQMYAIPFSESFMKIGKNLLTFYIVSPPYFDDFALYRNSGYYINDYASIQIENNGYFYVIIVGITFFMVFFFLLVYIRNSFEIHYLYFTFFLIPFGIYSIVNTQLPYMVIADTQVIQVAEFCCLALLGIPFTLFVKKISGIRVTRFDKITFAISLLVGLSIPFGGSQYKVDLCYISEFLMMYFIVYACAIAYMTVIKQIKALAKKENYTFLKTSVYIISNTLLGNIVLGLFFSEIALIYGVYSITFLHVETTNVITIIFLVIICMAFALIDDITRTKLYIKNHNQRLEDEVNTRTTDLLEQTKLAQAASETKSKFLATMSHELRSPMNAIIGITDIELMKLNLPKDTLASLNKVRNAGQNLLTILNDILDLAKIETGKLELINAVYETACMINDSVQMNITRIGSKPIEFILKVDKNIPSVLIGDELKIKRILNNLLSNAIKYTDRGSVTLEVSHNVSYNNIDLIFQVSDSGQGMKPEDLESLFLEYSRFNEDVNNQVEGTGLGMNITRHLVSLMQGSIDVQSEYGKGSVFTVSLKQSCPAEIIPLGSAAVALLENFSFSDERNNVRIKRTLMPYGKVLVVDDNPTNLFVANGLLEPYHLKIETATNGYRAIECAKTTNYDIIFMDHMMPDMDGIEATKHIRNAGYDGVIIALTANAIVGNDELFRANGFDDFMSKPINLIKMDTVLNTYIRDAHPGEKSQVETSDKMSKDIANNTFRNELYRIFIGDIKNTLDILSQHSDLQAYTITVHAIKAALGNIGEYALADEAEGLESAGRSNDEAFINENASAFVNHLVELTKRLEKILENTQQTVIDASEEDFTRLTKQYTAIYLAAINYDVTMIDDTIKTMEQTNHCEDTRETIKRLKDLALASDFEEIATLLSQKINLN